MFQNILRSQQVIYILLIIIMINLDQCLESIVFHAEPDPGSIQKKKDPYHEHFFRVLRFYNK